MSGVSTTPRIRLDCLGAVGGVGGVRRKAANGVAPDLERLNHKNNISNTHPIVHVYPGSPLLLAKVFPVFMSCPPPMTVSAPELMLANPGWSLASE